MKALFVRFLLLSIVHTFSVCYANDPRIGEIKSLGELEEALSKDGVNLEGALIAFDFDETLFSDPVTKDINKTPTAEGEITEFGNTGVRKTMASDLIETLKNKGAKVIGLTARSTKANVLSRKQLKKVGITFSDDFNDINFNLDSVNGYKDQGKDENIPFIKGILYTNQQNYIMGQGILKKEDYEKKGGKDKVKISMYDGKRYEYIEADKGAFLKRFLNVVEQQAKFVPTAIILVDDKQASCDSFVNALKSSEIDSVKRVCYLASGFKFKYEKKTIQEE